MTTANTSRVLLVDGEGAAETHRRWLSEDGFDVQTANPGLETLERLAERHFDVIVSTIPGFRVPPPYDLVLPLVTLGAESDDDEHAPWRLPHNPPRDLLARTVAHVAKVGHLVSTRRSMLRGLGLLENPVAALPGLARRFDGALERLFMVYQPVVRWPGRELIGVEGFVRSDDPILSHPAALLDASHQLDREPELGQHIHRSVADWADQASFTGLLFVNLMVEELDDPHLGDPNGPLGRRPGRVVFELSERDSLVAVPHARAQIARLRALGYRFALDNLGAGTIGLSSFARLSPDFAKLDRRMIRNIEREPARRLWVKKVVGACHDLGIRVIAAGVETPGERDALSSLGCDLMQGHLFAHPRREAPVTPPE